MTDRRSRLEHLTARWRQRHDARRPRTPADRPQADPEREALARRVFPYRDQSAAAYAEAHGAQMPGFTYDEVAYRDAELDQWLLELGVTLRARRAEQRREDGG